MELIQPSFLWQVIFGAIVSIILVWITYSDAKKLGAGEDAWAWAVGVFALAIVFLPVYLLLRSRIGKRPASTA